MTINFTKKFISDLDKQALYISFDKPVAAKKFKKDLIHNLKKDLKFPYQFKKSIYFEDELVRDYVFKGYTATYQINLSENSIEIFGFLKHKLSI